MDGEKAFSSWSIRGSGSAASTEQAMHIVNSEVIACDCFLDRNAISAGLEMDFEKLRLGNISLVRYNSWGTHGVRRTQHHLRRDDSDDILFYVPLTARYQVKQSDNGLALVPGTAAFVNLRKPFATLFIGSGTSPSSAAHVRIPFAMARERLPRIDEYMNSVIPLNPGSGRVMLSLLRSMLNDAPHFCSQSYQSFGDALLNVICSVTLDALNHQTDASSASDSKGRNVTRKRIMDYVAVNLCNPDLCPELIARHCRISLRSLHHAFEAMPLTLTSWIKEQRLQKCHAALTHPNSSGQTVAEIAYAWGFKDISHFSRAYRARFGRSPGQDRPLTH